jgi:hypothetical protein
MFRNRLADEQCLTGRATPQNDIRPIVPLVAKSNRAVGQTVAIDLAADSIAQRKPEQVSSNQGLWFSPGQLDSLIGRQHTVRR